MDEQDQMINEVLGVPTPTVEEPVIAEPIVSEEPIVEEPVVEETLIETKPQTETTETEPTADEIIASLRQQILELSAPRQVYPQENVTTAEKPAEVPAKVSQEVSGPQGIEQILQVLGDNKFLSDEELDRIIDEPQLLNDALRRSQENMLKQLSSALPQMMREEARKQNMIQMAVQEFYTMNPDLAPFAKFVQYVFAEQEHANPNITYEELFNKSAEISRKRLGLKNPTAATAERAPGVKQNPGFAGTRSSARRPSTTGPKIDPDMAEVLGI